MRIHVSSGHVYPGWLNGVASHVVHDYLVQGLAELGHDVRYQCRGWGQVRPPEGVRQVSDITGDEDILHLHHRSAAESPVTDLPWVRTIHSDLKYQGLTPDSARPNFIYVSRTIARLFGSDRHVHNGIDPANFIYSKSKEDYFLFAVAGGVEKARMKGLDIALRVAKLRGLELRVAGGGVDPSEMAEFERYCRDYGAEFLGLVQGRRKAEVFAGARALLFPTQMNEACSLTVIEALMSGTPVIASDKGAMAEQLDPSVGFICSDESSYLSAVDDLDRIAPQDCRRVAMERFHYLEMARSYVREYEREIAHTSLGLASRP
jgi:glycosyltransferase involved in cell wall biosynthesis